MQPTAFVTHDFDALYVAIWSKRLCKNVSLEVPYSIRNTQKSNKNNTCIGAGDDRTSTDFPQTTKILEFIGSSMAEVVVTEGFQMDAFSDAG